MKSELIAKINEKLWQCNPTTLEAIYNALCNMLKENKAGNVFDFISKLFYGCYIS